MYTVSLWMGIVCKHVCRGGAEYQYTCTLCIHVHAAIIYPCSCDILYYTLQACEVLIIIQCTSAIQVQRAWHEWRRPRGQLCRDWASHLRGQQHCLLCPNPWPRPSLLGAAWAPDRRWNTPNQILAGLRLLQAGVRAPFWVVSTSLRSTVLPQSARTERPGDDAQQRISGAPLPAKFGEQCE